MTFNILIVAVCPYMIISLGWDVVFFQKLNGIEEYKTHRFWLSLERLTTHIPLIIAGIVPFFFGIEFFVTAGLPKSDPNLLLGYIYALFLLFIPITTIDVRFSKRTIWKTGLAILFGGIFFSTLWGILIFFVF